MRGKRAFVTGGGGFIGSHLVERLVTEGAEVTALLHYNAERSIANLRHLPAPLAREPRLVFGDIGDAEFLAKAIEGSDLVFHLAALIAIPYSYRAPRSYLTTNAGGTLNLLEAARRGSVGRLIHVSTSEVYGSALTVPIDESHPLQAQSPYAASKIAADKFVEAYHRAFGVPVVTVRPFNTYGPRQSTRAFIPTVITQALAGPTVKLGATAPVRDLTFVTDTVAGFLAAAGAEGIEGRTFNLGTGAGHGIGDVARTILTLMSSGAEIVLDAERLRPDRSEVDRLISDNRAICDATGWRPAISLEEGLRQTIAFFRNQPASPAPDSYAV
ncbi:MAG TPA: GDP-mannose 4,6-dehydratase [Hypericibacter adhaerens]|jgi:NAD dependent epimerase/dehydratase|uniref:NAD-dependent dehydratase n=1 Tax=Hypericibacter adhaerens TaxID=2602016 RepID=A0A5J6MVI5_9PROT|nr:GDP-mannose 4,6-dehydratase [Hypericibacter adhaerens]QEX21449.1 NAD-dependent dehydratase [Hypericibacter adhaerens]HWA43189.1 GDP-mannose 4,6-dehydratase [Hypericibacter adhaerens]